MAAPRVVSIDLITNPAGVVAGNAIAQASFEETAAVASAAGAKIAASLGGALAAVDAQFATFGLPFTGALGKVGTSLEETEVKAAGLSGALGGLGTQAAIGGAVAFAVIGAASVKAASDFEASHARLETAAKDVGETLSNYGAQVAGADNKLEKFGFTNAETENSLARLTTATKNVQASTDLMGLAADIARGRNLSLQDATDILTKAEQGRYIQLTRLGIISKEAAGTFRTQADAVAYLQSKFSGQAAAYAETFAGKIDALKATATDLGVQLGEVLIPQIEGVASAIVGAVGGIQSLNSATGGLVGGVAEVGAVIGVSILAVRGLAAAYETIGGLFGATSAQQAALAAQNQLVAASFADLGTAAASASPGINAVIAAKALDAETSAQLIATNEALAASWTRLTVTEIDEALALGQLTREEALAAFAAHDLAAATAEATAAAELYEAGVLSGAAGLTIVVGAASRATAAQKAFNASLEEAGAARAAADIESLAIPGAAIGSWGLLASNITTVGVALGAIYAGLKTQHAGGFTEGILHPLESVQRALAVPGIGPGGLFPNVPGIAGAFNAPDSGGPSKLEQAGASALTGPLNADQVDEVRKAMGGYSVSIGEVNDALAAYRAAQLQGGSGTEAFLNALGVTDEKLKGTGKTVADVDVALGDFSHGSYTAAQAMTPAQLAAATLSGAQEKLAQDMTRTGISSQQLATDQQAVNTAAAANEKFELAAAAATLLGGTAAARQSAAMKILKIDIDNLRDSNNPADWKATADAIDQVNTAVYEDTVVTRAANLITREAQARADALTGSVLSLTDAYVLLGNIGSSDAVSSLDSINKAAFSQFDANQAAAGATDDLNSALKDLATGSDSAAGSQKTAAAAAIEHQQKVLALRDALLAVGDQERKVQDAERGITDAQRGLADARRDQRTALLTLADAERQYDGVMHGVARSTKEAQDAEENLRKSRLDARSRTLDVKDAEQALRDAKTNVVDVSQFGDPREVADAKEKVQRAQIALEEARLAAHDSTTAQTEATRIYNGTLYGFALGSKEATDAQNTLTQAQQGAITANQQVESASRQVTAATLALRDANNQTAATALNLVRAQADIDGALEKSNKKLDDHKKKIDEVRQKAEAAALLVGAAFASASKSTATGIEAQINYLRDLVAKYPVLKGAFDQVLANLQASLKFAPTGEGPSPSLAPPFLSPTYTGIRTQNEQRLFNEAMGTFLGPPNPADVAQLHAWGVPGYAEGGFVPGAPGTPVQLVAHGGEYIVSVAELQGQPRADSPFHDLLAPTAPATATAAATTATPASLTAAGTPGPTELPAAFAAAGTGLVTSFSDGLKAQWIKVVDPFFAGMRRSVLTNFTGAKDWLRQPGTDIMAGFHQSLLVGWQPIDVFFEQLPNQLRAQTNTAVAATRDSWQGIKGAFAVPVVWSITNVLNPLIADVDAIAAALGMKAIATPIPPIAGFATGGVVDRDQMAHVHAGEGILPAAAMGGLKPGQFEMLRSGEIKGFVTGGTVEGDEVAQVHAGEGVLPAAAMLTLTPAQFEGLRTGQRLEDIFRRTEATKAIDTSPYGGLVAGLDTAASSDVAAYLGAIPAPVTEVPFVIGTPIPTGSAGPTTRAVEFAHMLEYALGDPVGGTNDRLLVAWQMAEGLVSADYFNPLNTTQKEPGATYGGGAVGHYRDWAMGLKATIDALHSARGAWYGQILADLRAAADPFKIAKDITKSPWADGHYGDPTGTTGGTIAQHLRELGALGTPATTVATGSLRDWVGRPGSYKAIEAYQKASGVPYTINSDVRPGSITAGGTLSLHSPGRAVDFGGPSLINIWKVWEAVKSTPLAELFYSAAPTFIDHSGEHPVGLMDAADRANHYSHVHVALEEGGVVDAPKSGAPAILHGRELVAPLPPNFDLAATLRRNAGGSSQTATTVKNYTIHVQSLDPRAARTVVLDALKEVERTDGFVPIRVGSG